MSFKVIMTNNIMICFFKSGLILLILSCVGANDISLKSDAKLLDEAGCNENGTLIIRGICINNKKAITKHQTNMSNQV